jgi:15-cis-phytoene synthase
VSRSADIARKSRSNLAFALATLPAQRRRDMIHFYAFCRVVDDLADDTDTPVEEKRAALATWRHAVLHGGEGVQDEVMTETVALPARYGFPKEHLAEIIDGVAADLDQDRYATFQDLLGYCYKVASVVGLASMKIFGAQQEQTRQYAVQLGYALQLTNIIRDVGEDARIGRIYLPQEDLQKFHVSEEDLLTGRSSPNFIRMMEFQYARAEDYYRKAEAALPAADKPVMIAARMMGQLYRQILHKLKAERYPVFEKRMKLSKLSKAWLLASYLTRGYLRR